ncbi:MAG: hypothetical protein HKN40_00030, partial [Winogradskyella sp.]|uniref:hypothetical protein n=1 Tax=Winogradskyella sp. TaxID=1883156 RepID=UPI00179DEFDC|nr:hypothetical protein [Winogradskyella sp.]
MKGLKLNIKICIITAFIIGVTMAILNLYPSWSQYAGNVQEPFLYATLFFISLAFMMVSFEHPDKLKELFVVKGMEVRLEHITRVIAYLFGGVLVFSVNSEVKVVETLHLIFTGSAILTGYLMLMTFYKQSIVKKNLALLGTLFGIIGFSCGFFLNLYSV